jgi:crotonobetainyl-CoA:carnitine CoA-transferase CaiB-like acyl-CoA transferase
MAKLGLDYGSLKKINPPLIYCSLTGYGQNGPLCMRAGHDINYLSLAGLMSYSGKKETGPSLMGMQIADIAAGSLIVIIGILAAVIQRKETGEGQHVDISMLDGLMAFNILAGAAYLAQGDEPARDGEKLNGGSLYDFYQTKDGEYMSLGALEPQFFRAFCETIRRPDLMGGGIAPENTEKIKSEIREIFRSKTRAEWADIFREVDACVEPVVSLREALTGEQCHAREMIVDIPLPNGRTVKQIANPIKFAHGRNVPVSAGVESGADTKETILHLGYSEEEYSELKQEKVFD